MVAEIGRWSLQVDPVTRMATQYESPRRIEWAARFVLRPGIGDTLGNKGAIGAAFRVHGTTLCFVCCHLEAFQGEVFGRNSDFSQVVSHHRAPSREIPPVAPELPRVARLTPSASGARTSMRCISSTTSSGLVT